MTRPLPIACLPLGLICLISASCNGSDEPGAGTADEPIGPGSQVLGGQTGDGSGGIAEASDVTALANDCNNDSEEIDDPEQTVPELGFSADDLLAAIEAGETSIAWQAAGAAAAPSDESVTITVAYAGGPITHRFYNSEQVPAQDSLAGDAAGESSESSAVDEPGGAESGLSPASESMASSAAADGDCPPEMTVEVEMTLSTSDGTLDETFTTTLRASDPSLVSFEHELPAAELNGSLEFEPLTDGQELSALHVEGMFTAYGSSGSITWQAGSPTDASSEPLEPPTDPSSEELELVDVEVSQGLLALWPSGRECAGAELGYGPRIPVAADQQFAHFGADEARAVFAGLEPLPLRWRLPGDWAGETAELTLEVEPGEGLCVEVYGGGDEAVRYPARVNAVSSDGRLDGQYQGAVLVASEDGTLGRGDVNIELLDVPVDEADAFGLASFDPGAQERVSSSLWLQWNQLTDDVSGGISIVALSDCPEEPAAPDGVVTSDCGLQQLVMADFGSTAEEFALQDEAADDTKGELPPAQ